MKPNTLKLDKTNKPHNPLTNAGSLVCCSLIEKTAHEEEIK